MKKRTTIQLLLLALLLCMVPTMQTALAQENPWGYAIEEPGPQAKGLALHCTLSSGLTSAAYAWRLADTDLQSAQVLLPGQWVSLSWREVGPIKAEAEQATPAATKDDSQGPDVGLATPQGSAPAEDEPATPAPGTSAAQADPEASEEPVTDPDGTPEPAATQIPARPPIPIPSQTPAAEVEAEPQEDDMFLFWALLGLLLLAVILLVGLSFPMKRWWVRILLWALALALCMAGAWLLFRSHQSLQEKPEETTIEPVRALQFTTETLPETSLLSAYPELESLDLLYCEQVDAALYEQIRQTIPQNCRILWAVPLSDGRFPSDSRSLSLPHFSASDAQLLPYFPQLKAVDASGSDAYDALLSLGENAPELSLAFTLPVGDQVLTMEDEALTVQTAPDFRLLEKMLPAFPRLKSLDLLQAPVDPAQVIDLMAQYPDRAVSYAVPVGKAAFPADSQRIALGDADIHGTEELLAALPYLPELREVDLHGTGLSLEDLLTILDACPGLTLLQGVTLLGQPAETDARELDLRDAEVDATQLLPLLRPFFALERVYLPQEGDWETSLPELTVAHPETRFICQVTVFDRVVENTLEELDISERPIASLDEVLTNVDKLPDLKKLIMCDCGLPNEAMEELMSRRPGVKFVWNVHLGPHTLRTDTLAFSTKNPTRYTQPYYSDSTNYRNRTTIRLKPGDIQELKYCGDLMALDLGHNFLTNEDLEVLRYLPHLQVLILADNKITDISALAQLKELQYVELFMNRIPDMSPLVGLPELTDINVANTHLEDIEPLTHLIHAKRLWFSMNGLTPEQNRAVVEALPDCVCNYTTNNSTGDGWREGERYLWIRELFQYGK